MEDLKILEIDDSYFECKSIIEFTSLIKILFKLSQKQKYLENKIDLVNSRVDEKENRLSNLEIQIKGESQSDDKKIIKSFESSPKITEKISPQKTEKFESSSKDINSSNKLNEENEEKDIKEKENEGEQKEEKKGENDEKDTGEEKKEKSEEKEKEEKAEKEEKEKNAEKDEKERRKKLIIMH